MGALRRRVGGRAHCLAISVGAGDLAFEASSTAAVALRLAILFDDRERVCRPRASLSETATISFLAPVFVALLAGPVLGERVSAERMIAIALGFLGVVIATRPGAGALQPIVLFAVAGVVCNSLYVLATRTLAGADAPQTTLAWTQVAGLVFLTPTLPWVWKQPGSVGVWVVMAVMGVFGATSHGMLIVAHRYAPAPTLTPFTYTQLIWMIISGVVVFGDWPAPATLVGAALVVACGAYLAFKERRGRHVATTVAVDADLKVQ
ncbi:MAG TPA: DMT family transporter [Roseiarcus sp.]|jgi:drug/metabolite transporter (DMT)-like permease|nr:DMT family transporter [Roseiarcus sp.]